jgi:hypothetical protein
MAPNSILRKFGSSVFAAGFAILPGPPWWSDFAGVQQQRESSQQQPSPPEQSPQPQPPPPDAKAKRVWTNDDVILLRTPADIYQTEKEAREAAAQAAAKKAPEAKPVREADPAIKLPATVEETEKLIKAKEDQIDDEQSALERLVKELPNAPEDQKTAMQIEVDRVAADLPKVRNGLKILQAHLEKLTKTQLNEAAPPRTAPSSQ